MQTNTLSVLTSPKAAEVLGIKPQTLRKWRVRGIGPRYIRYGVGPQARIVYRLSDLEAWLASHAFASTSEETVRRGRP